MAPSQRLLPLAVFIGLIFNPPALAQTAAAEAGASDAATELETIQVTGRRAARQPAERLSRDTIEQEIIHSNRDIVRYSPDVGVADQGRHSKGFAIRGVEDNRVGISIDGVALPGYLPPDKMLEALDELAAESKGTTAASGSR